MYNKFRIFPHFVKSFPYKGCENRSRTTEWALNPIHKRLHVIHLFHIIPNEHRELFSELPFVFILLIAQFSNFENIILHFL